MPELGSIVVAAVSEGAAVGAEKLAAAGVGSDLGSTCVADMAVPLTGDIAGDLALASGHSLEALAKGTDIAFDALEASPIANHVSEGLRRTETIGTGFEGRPELTGLEWDDTYWTVDYDHDWDCREFTGVGDPAGAAECWQRQTENSCAVMSQVGVIEYITGQRLTEAQATRIARNNGWYDPASGTYPADCAQLLERQGIPCDVGYDYDMGDIATALENGEQVIVGLDATAIWYPQRDAITGELVYVPEGRGHAVWITGVDVDAMGNWTVIMNDTGHPSGRMRAVALEDFLAGWDEYENFAVITRHGPTPIRGSTELAGNLSGQAIQPISSTAGQLSPGGEHALATDTETA